MSSFKIIKYGEEPAAAAEEKGREVAEKIGKLPKTAFVSYETLLRPKGADPEDDPLVKIRKEQEAARAQTEAMIAQAQAEVERIEKEAYERGFAKGVQEGEAAMVAKFTTPLAQVGSLITALTEDRARLYAGYEKDLLPLIRTMVDQLAHHEISVNPLVVQSCLRRALEFVVESSVVRVRLHPDDYARIKEAGIQDPALLQGRNQVHLIEDPAISMGGCYLESDFGEVDATHENLRTRLFKAVQQAFLAALAEKGGAP